MVCDPTRSTDVWNVATLGALLLLSVALPIKIPPSKKETVPVGAVAGVGKSATVAVNVAAVPSVAGVVAERVVVVTS
jgi:hypothetical protein